MVLETYQTKILIFVSEHYFVVGFLEISSSN
jgi:hypothetical protein